MEGENGFYVTLLSNTPHHSKRNTASHFYTELPRELNFTNEKWEVALVETDIPIAWYNLPREPSQTRHIIILRAHFKLKPGKEADLLKQRKRFAQSISLEPGEPGITNVTFGDFSTGDTRHLDIDLRDYVDEEKSTHFASFIPYGNYNNIHDLIREINKILLSRDQVVMEEEYENFPRGTHITLDSQNLRPCLHVAPGDDIYLSREMCQILRLDCGEGARLCYNDLDGTTSCDVIIFRGQRFMTEFHGSTLLSEIITLDPSNPEYPFEKYQACAVPSFSSHVSNVFIYSNIVDFEVTGNVLTKLLKVVRGQGNFGDDIKIMFPKPQYKKVAQDIVKEIEVELKNDQGELLPFEFGIVTLLLHFRRTKL